MCRGCHSCICCNPGCGWFFCQYKVQPSGAWSCLRVFDGALHLLISAAPVFVFEFLLWVLLIDLLGVTEPPSALVGRSTSGLFCFTLVCRLGGRFRRCEPSGGRWSRC